jgi:CheY-like chemotaxis protein
VLTDSGFTVETCNDSTIAFNLFKKSPDAYDLIISDLTMPDMTGDTLCSKISKIEPEVAIILLTGYHENITLEEQQPLGINKVLPKPVSIQKLLATIKELIN